MTQRAFRIAYLINSLEGGGAQSPLPAILSSLERAGAKVRLFALARKDGKAIAALEDAGIEPLIYDGALRNHPGALAWTMRHLTRFQPDAIWTSLTRATLIGQIVGARLGVPVASWQHSAFLKPWNERLLRWRRSASNIWIADSEAVAELTRKRLRLEAGKVTTWPIFFADPGAAQASPWQQGEPVRIGTIGRLHVSKGFDTLLEAAALLEQRTDIPPFSIEIGGDGADRAMLEGKAAAIGLSSVGFAGFVEKPARFLARLHLYVQPSRREGFCIAMHEAMQAGLPVVVSRVGEMPHTVTVPAMGRIVEPDDAIALAAGLAEMLDLRHDFAELGKAARGRVLELFPRSDFDAKAAELVNFLKQAADFAQD